MHYLRRAIQDTPDEGDQLLQTLHGLTGQEVLLIRSVEDNDRWHSYLTVMHTQKQHDMISIKQKILIKGEIEKITVTERFNGSVMGTEQYPEEGTE